MGLDTTHDCWHGPYGGFQEFRLYLAEAAGIPVGPAKPGSWNAGRRHMAIDWEIYPQEVYEGRWRKNQPYWLPEDHEDDIYGVKGHQPHYDDVLYLLIHSDCDGKLRRGYLPKLWARLKELQPRYREVCVEDHYAGRLDQFIEGLQAAISANEHVVFS